MALLPDPACRQWEAIRSGAGHGLRQNLRQLLAAADRTQPAPRSAVPVCRDMIAEATADVRTLSDGLVASGPVAAPGVARNRGARPKADPFPFMGIRNVPRPGGFSASHTAIHEGAGPCQDISS
jgi:hypothetical protein